MFGTGCDFLSWAGHNDFMSKAAGWTDEKRVLGATKHLGDLDTDEETTF